MISEFHLPFNYYLSLSSSSLKTPLDLALVGQLLALYCTVSLDRSQPVTIGYFSCFQPSLMSYATPKSSLTGNIGYGNNNNAFTTNITKPLSSTYGTPPTHPARRQHTEPLRQLGPDCHSPKCKPTNQSPSDPCES